MRNGKEHFTPPSARDPCAPATHPTYRYTDARNPWHLMRQPTAAWHCAIRTPRRAGGTLRSRHFDERLLHLGGRGQTTAFLRAVEYNITTRCRRREALDKHRRSRIWCSPLSTTQMTDAVFRRFADIKQQQQPQDFRIFRTKSSPEICATSRNRFETSVQWLAA